MSELRVIEGEQQEVYEARPPEFSDDHLALAFAERHADDLRYVAKWGRWFRWDGARWAEDGTRIEFDFARKICREAAARCNENFRKQIASGKTVAAVVNLSMSDRRIAATVDQWDADHWLFNTPGGTVDLRTGQIRHASQGDYITKTAGVAPDPLCPIELWLKVLDRATGNDGELVSYLQRLCGYSLTGETREHSLHFFHGTGANSKTTSLNTMSQCFGDYAKTAPIEAFTAASGDRHPTEIAMLRGARLVTANETEDGRRWAESKIKALTGGDPVVARFMRKDFFEFIPQFTLVVAGNNKPGLRSVDEAIRRRFHLVPFLVTIPEAERDPTLGERLRDELPGILHWMIQGCLDWQQRGLDPPDAVRAATDAYLESEDALAAWIEDECERDPNASASASELFARWKAWAERSGEFAGDTKRFRDRLETRGFEHGRTKTGRRYQGLRLKPPDNPTDYWDR